MKEANPHLMDIPGDTVHMVNNSAIALFDKMAAFHPIQPALSVVYKDLRLSRNEGLIQLFTNILLWNIKGFLSVLRPLQTRFLPRYEVVEKMLKLDVLWIYYYGMLTAEEKKAYTPQLGSIFSKYKIKTAIVECLRLIIKNSLYP